MNPPVLIVDYGMGNLFSVARAFEHCGADVEVSEDPEKILGAPILVIPGVGAFSDGMDALKKRGLVEPIRHYAETKKPLLGICLGMQMLFDLSEEFGTHEGLGLIPGKVVAIPNIGENGRPHKIPHIGWNQLLPHSNNSWTHTILENLEPDASTYFVHSFAAVPENSRHRLANVDYNGLKLAAAVRSENIYGCQFHPEKSGWTGLKIIENFLKLARAT